MSGHTIVLGDDGLAALVLEELMLAGREVVAVHPPTTSPLAETAARMGVRVVSAETAGRETLRAAGIEGAAALALLAEDELMNLTGVLAAAELRPEVRTVVRIGRPQLAHGVESLLDNGTVLSDTELAAPTLIHAAIHGRTREMFVRERRLVVREADADDPALRVALVDGAHTDHLFPRDAARVVGVVDDGGRGPEPQRIPRRTRLEPLVREFAAAVDLRWLIAFGIVTTIVAVATVVFAATLEGGIGMLDGLYFTVTTITTTGYGNYTLVDTPPWLKLFGIAVIILGGLAITLIYGLIIDAIVSLRLARALGRQRAPTRDHVVICGLGTVGARVLEGLHARGVPVAGVDARDDSPGVAAARRLGLAVRLGDASDPEVLKDLNIRHARSVLALTDSDVSNLEAALAAHATNPEITVVVRLYDADLAARVQRTVGVTICRSVAALAAPAFAAAVLGAAAEATMPIGARTARVRTLRSERSATVAELEEGNIQARLLWAEGTWFPHPDTAVSMGSDLVAIGTSTGLAELESRLIDG